MNKDNNVHVNVDTQKINSDPILLQYEKNLTSKNVQKKELEKSVKTMEVKTYSTAIIGIGQCGGNIANDASGRGFLTCAVNTSEEDLVGCNTNLKYVFKNAYGSGKERSRSKDIFKKNINDFNTFFSSNFSGVKNIIIVASAAGGTGGGSAPMCARFLKDNYQNKNIFLIMVQGSIYEDIKSQENMLSVMEEINKCEVNYLIFDNLKAEQSGKEPEDVNEEIIKAAEFISRNYFIESTVSNIDNADMQKLYLENKRMVIVSGNFDRKISSKTDYINQMINAVKESSQIDPSGDPMAYAIFMSVEDGIYDSIDTNFRDIVDEFGEAYEIYKHFQSKVLEAPDFVICMTGLSECVDRYEQINKRVAEFNQRREYNKSISDIEKVSINARGGVGVTLPEEEEENNSTTIDTSAIDMF